MRSKKSDFGVEACSDCPVPNSRPRPFDRNAAIPAPTLFTATGRGSPRTRIPVFLQSMSQWDSLPVHVERDFRDPLEIFAQKRVSVTCFFLGYIAERFPHPVREALAAGHEIASHGYAHELVWKRTPEGFLEDVRTGAAGCRTATSRPILSRSLRATSASSRSAWLRCRVENSAFSAAATCDCSRTRRSAKWCDRYSRKTDRPSSISTRARSTRTTPDSRRKGPAVQVLRRPEDDAARDAFVVRRLRLLRHRRSEDLRRRVGPGPAPARPGIYPPPAAPVILGS